MRSAVLSGIVPLTPITIIVPLVLIALLVISAAHPFAPLPATEAAYTHLQAIADAGLLDGFNVPAAGLSRLEAAVLAQRGLKAYGEACLAGQPTDPAVEKALAALSTSLADELAQLGSAPPSAMPTPTPSADDGTLGSLADRIAALEDSTAADEEQATEEETPAPEEELGIATNVYGNFYMHGDATRTAHTQGGETQASDMHVYWGELGYNAEQGNWRGHFSLLWNDVTEDVGVFEAWVGYDDAARGWFARAGQSVLPFGNNAFYFPTFPAVNDLGYTTAHTLALGLDRPDCGASVWVFNPKVEMVDEDDTLSDASVVWDVTKRRATPCEDGWRLTAGYTTHLNSNDIRLAGTGPHHKRMAAYNVFGRYDWQGNTYHVLADYTAALDRFDVRDLDANGDGVGDQPRALNTELVYEPCPDNLWGVAYEWTGEMKDYAKQRYGVLYGRRLSELATLKLEYTHGVYGQYATAGQDSDDRFVAEVALIF